MQNPSLTPAHTPPTDDGAGPRREPKRRLGSPHAAAFVAALRSCDPFRSAFDVAVRRFVRAERDIGRTLDEVLEEIRTALRIHVAPSLTPDRTSALQTAAQWFAVSEYHRAD